MLTKIKKCIEYLINPKYVVMKGIQIDNRAIMFIGARPTAPYDKKREIEIHGYVSEDTQKLKISFENQKYQTYWKSNKYKTIYTFRELMFWVRLVGANGYKTVQYNKLKFKWEKINAN